MTINSKFYLLIYLQQKKQEQGFTLVELLVVIIIIGILSAIALPIFLDQTYKARESEAKTYVSSVNRAQLSYRLQKKRYSSNLDGLYLGISNNTNNYNYVINGNTQTATIVALPQDAASHKGFSGGNVTQDDGESFMEACQTMGTQAQNAAVPPILDIDTGNDPILCGSGMEVME